MPEFDFANILFSGPCNRFCPFCIGKEVLPEKNENNLDIYPPRNWETFVAEVVRRGINELVFTGTTTDPHLYRHEANLISRIREQLPDRKISVHTNGVLSLKKISTFNRYDRACISFPTFDADTYEKMMGSRKIPDLKALVGACEIPLKISCIVNEHNVGELESFLEKLQALGIRRVVLRRLLGDRRNWRILPEMKPVRYYRGNPVYDLGGMEVTYWNFDATESRSINLFADGTLSQNYLLTKIA